MRKEIWKDIEGYEGYYQASSFGNIRSIDREVPYIRYGISLKKKMKGKVLSPAIKNSGYFKLALSSYNNLKHSCVHRLVAETFIPNPKKLKCVNHIDGDKLNNNIENLEWISHTDNNIHAFKTGLKKVNENHGRSKLKNEEVYEIKELISLGIPQRQIAFMYEVSPSTIHLIKTGKNWSYLK